MKRTFLLLALLPFLATVVSFAQKLEIKTIASTSKIDFPKWDYPKGVFPRIINIIDTVDNYLICKEPGAAIYRAHEVFLLHKDSLTVKRIEMPKEYAKYTPVYMCKLGGNHFVKFKKAYKKYALALYDEHMHFIKVKPMGNFGLLCTDANYVYFQNAPVSTKVDISYNGELIKMDKEMNVVLTQPVTVLWDHNYSSNYGAVDTLGHIIFNNLGTHMLIDRETLAQTKLDFKSGFVERTIYEADRMIRIAFCKNRSGCYTSVQVFDYKGNLLKSQTIDRSCEVMTGYMAYKEDKLYFLVNEKKNLSFIEYNISDGTTRTLSSFDMVQNPGYAPPQTNANYSFGLNPWVYENNTFNVLIGTTETIYSAYNKYFSFIHLDENFNRIKIEEETYNKILLPEYNSYRILHKFDDFTLLIKEKVDKWWVTVRFVFWDMSGNKTEMTSDIQYDRGNETRLVQPAVFKISPTRYYILHACKIGKKRGYRLSEVNIKLE